MYMDTAQALAKKQDNPTNELSVREKIKDLKQIIEFETEKRKIMRKYVRDNLKEDVDFGTIKGQSRSGAQFESKKVLFKPGAEKICSLFNLKPVFEKDNDTWTMFGNKVGTLCLICKLFNQSGEIVGEGRGVATINETGMNENKLVKIAEKRAQLDAVIRFAALSDVFTQDADQIKDAQEGGGTGTNRKMKVHMVTEGQLTKIAILLSKKGKDKHVLYKHYKVESMKELTFRQADLTIQKLETYPDIVKDAPKVEEVVEPAKESIRQAASWQQAWVKMNFDKLQGIGAIQKSIDIKTVDFLTEAEYAQIKSVYDKFVANSKK